MKGIRLTKHFLRVWLILAATLLLTFSLAACALAGEKTYTLDGDFDQGTLVNVQHETAHDQLQLSTDNVTLPFIWVPNMDGTVSKLNTDTGQELARYRIAPATLPNGGNPSRTTVDLQGNCWVGCRAAGTVVKIGLLETDNWIDRNNNGVCDTCKDLNNSGYIETSEVLPWGQDECVLYEVVLIPNKVGTYVPGTYTLGYDTSTSGTAPRGIMTAAIGAAPMRWTAEAR
jgi:hypothetical protein